MLPPISFIAFLFCTLTRVHVWVLLAMSLFMQRLEEDLMENPSVGPLVGAVVSGCLRGAQVARQNPCILRRVLRVVCAILNNRHLHVGHASYVSVNGGISVSIEWNWKLRNIYIYVCVYHVLYVRCERVDQVHYIDNHKPRIETRDL